MLKTFNTLKSYSSSIYTIYWCIYIFAVEVEVEAEVEVEVEAEVEAEAEFDVRVRISCVVEVIVVVEQASGFARGVSIPEFVYQSISVYLFPVSE